MEISSYIMWAGICWLVPSLLYYLDTHSGATFYPNVINEEKPTEKQLEKLKEHYQKIYNGERNK
ncbi:hypothetical protein [Sediminitomix flava]|uniref:Uncharacterized protein n=1 Tax=Sediminitomix flava TaxID=379075 RepID=A0A315ZJT7_SEDFL|nr:hypothetical protein [Sediminitomix flava]PWJ34171.1 hypothetical protein BC781_11181 [Sediminitomix flava]